MGSAAIAHSAAKTVNPIEEGIVSLLEPFLDTVVICTMTALVLVISGAYNNPEYIDIIHGNNGAALTSRAFAQSNSYFPYVLCVVVFLFAYSTIISWSYYGERCFTYLFGEKYSIFYKVLLVVILFLGAIASSTHIMDFGDLMILGMGFPNLIGVFVMRKEIREALTTYQKVRRRFW
jgi:AGCS family alanine or glycine:cation symporter